MPEPLRILTIIPDFDRRGTQRVAENFSADFRRRGHDVAVMAMFATDGPRRASIERADLRVITPAPDLDAGIARAIAFAPDVVHVHRAGMFIAVEDAMLARLRPHSKAIVETNIFARPDGRARGLIDVHFHITRCGLYRWGRLIPPALRHEQPGIYLPNALDVDSFARSDPAAIAAYRRDRLGAAPGDFVFGRIGKSDPRVFRTFGEVLSRVPHARLASGEDAGLSAAIAACPEAVRRRIAVVPPTDSDAELSLFYSSIDALLHWSYNGESFGLVLAEAIGCGTPVVMPLQPHLDIGGVEVVGHGEGGLIAGSAAGLADAAVEMVRERPAFDDGRLARAQARHRREYRVATVADRALDAMRLAIEGRRDGRPLGPLFDGDPRFETRVPRAWFKELIARRLGRTSAVEGALHRVTHGRALWRLPAAARSLSRRLGR